LGNLLEVILLEMMEQNKLNTFQFILPTNGRLSIFQNLAYLMPPERWRLQDTFSIFFQQYWLVFFGWSVPCSI